VLGKTAPLSETARTCVLRKCEYDPMWRW